MVEATTTWSHAIPDEGLQRLGKLIAERRSQASLSRAALAPRAGLSESTLKNLEHGRHRPSLATLSQLCGVAELGLDLAALTQCLRGGQPEECSVDGEGPLNCWLSPGLDPMGLVRELSARLRGRGGLVEQSFLYLDHKSAECWFDISHQSDYACSRNMVPLQAASRCIQQRWGDAGVDIIGLGCGDGYKEVRLAQMLASRERTLRLYLLDISQPMLAHAYRHAAQELQDQRVQVFAQQGNFHELPRYSHLLPAKDRRRRRRLLCMFGGTLGNLANELLFVQNTFSGYSTDDLLLVHVGLVRAPASDPQAVQRLDPRLNGSLPTQVRALEREFLLGPIERYSRAVGTPLPEVELHAELDLTCCVVPGSYAIHDVAVVHGTDSEPARRFVMGIVKRYDPEQLGEALRTLGWEPIGTFCDEDALLLLRKT